MNYFKNFISHTLYPYCICSQKEMYTRRVKRKEIVSLSEGTERAEHVAGSLPVREH